jgi:NADP-dependent 3-hydroxy acid dehydrogenase YdfG
MKDNVVLITGASSGIGEAVARELVRRGARVVLCARRTDLLEKVAAELRSAGGSAIAVACDVTRDGDPEAAVARAVAEWGRLDTVLANAGFAVAGRLEALTLDDYRRQLETNLFGTIRTLKAALPELKKSRGRIGVVGSVNGFIGTPATSAYCASKFAVRGLCDSIRPELKPHGVSVTHIAPGFVESEIRAKDNREVVHRDAKDPVPAWLVASAESAANEIANALARRKREQVVTFHGKVVVFLERHLSWLVAQLVGVVDADKREDRRRGASPGA